MYLSCCFIQTAWVDTPLPLSTTYGLTHPSEIRGFHLTRASSWSSQNLSNVNNPGSIDAVHVDWVMQVEQVEKKWEPTWMKPVGKLLIQGCRYYHATSKSAVFTGNPWVPHFSGSRKSTEVQPCVCLHSYGHLSVISTYNPVYRMYNPIYN